MACKFGVPENEALDMIIASRRTCREFTGEPPTDAELSAVIEAGIRSPFASVSSRDREVFRHFYVLRKGDERIEEISALVTEQSAADLADFRAKRASDELLLKYGDGLDRLWSGAATRPMPMLVNAPSLVIVSEWRGARRAERQSLAHCMQNMWLKATALGLGFAIISAVESMVYNEKFCALFENEPGGFGYHACVVGKAKNENTPASSIRARVTWL